ncbi:DUF3515 domain-containing protein [Nocardioides yefusunii]|uniref:DUF3515 domain-containing protein n=1 Tax=Nocardioides yefusunii TaxID=2500546 RepID=A0ABW1QYP4_9ACTN|nr:DUF3515 domain-containing protein [Nocardioides yefusunii]
MTTLPRPTRVLALALAAPLLAACSGAVEVETPPVDAADVKTCEKFVDSLPAELFGQERRDVSGSTTAAAWGAPPIVLQCGAKVPSEFDAFSSCSQIDDVGWFMPDSQLKDQSKDITLTAQSHSPRVTVTVPATFRSNAPDAQLAVLGELVHEQLTETQPCV